MTDDVNQLREQVKTLRQGLWDCAKYAGADLDGDTEPHMANVYLVSFAVDAVRVLRADYDTEGGEAA